MKCILYRGQCKRSRMSSRSMYYSATEFPEISITFIVCLPIQCCFRGTMVAKGRDVVLWAENHLEVDELLQLDSL